MGTPSQIEQLRRRLDRRRAEYDEARRVQALVLAPNWPDVKWWIEEQMEKCGDTVATEPLQIASLMGGWNALRLLLKVARQCQDLTDLEVNLHTLQKEFQDKALKEK